MASHWCKPWRAKDRGCFLGEHRTSLAGRLCLTCKSWIQSGFRSMLHVFFVLTSGVLYWIVLILVWFERSLHSAQGSGQSCPWPLKLMTLQAAEGPRDVNPHRRLLAAQNGLRSLAQAVKGRYGVRVKTESEICLLRLSFKRKFHALQNRFWGKTDCFAVCLFYLPFY